MLSLWTAARRNEVIGSSWTELDLDLGVWRLPGARTKNAKPHEIPLPRQAVALLHERPPPVTARAYFRHREIRHDRSRHTISATRYVAPRPTLGVWSRSLRTICGEPLRRISTRDEQCHRVVLERILNHSRPKRYRSTTIAIATTTNRGESSSVGPIGSIRTGGTRLTFAVAE